jgi:hypothetical protein
MPGEINHGKLKKEDMIGVVAPSIRWPVLSFSQFFVKSNSYWQKSVPVA